MARVVTVYTDNRGEFRPVEMGYIRWLKISEALARRGHEVHMATNETFPPAMEAALEGTSLGRVALRDVRWSDYDAVKTLFNLGFETLHRYGGTSHPFIISKLGSVVDAKDREGILFYGAYRERLFALQEEMNGVSRYITLLSDPAIALWHELFGPREILLVPGAADHEIPPAGPDPYPDGHGIARVLFAGNVYFHDSQAEANVVLVEKLNQLGEILRQNGCRLYMIGTGDTSKLDARYVTGLGHVTHDAAWNYFAHAQVGIVVSAASFMHNNESTKIYHYLRAGLPVVSEAGFPNDNIVRDSGLGVVADNGDMPAMARHVIEASRSQWDRAAAVRYVLEHHTWDVRADVYDRLLRKQFS